MKPVKQVEIFIEAVEINNFLVLLKQVVVVGYSIIRHVGGRGERGERRPDEFVCKVGDVYFVDALVAAIRPMLVKFCGMSLISDAIWVHKTSTSTSTSSIPRNTST